MFVKSSGRICYNIQEFYAVFDVKVVVSGGIEVKIPGSVTYYTEFDETAKDVKADSKKPHPYI